MEHCLLGWVIQKYCIGRIVKVTLSDEYVGISKETLEAITLEQWNELYLGASGMYIRIALTDTTQVLTKIEVDFSN